MKKIYFRLANLSDKKDLFIWRNDYDDRKSSFNSKKISISAHNRWFTDLLTNQDIRLFIAYTIQDGRIGMIRFDRKEDCAEISISVCKKQRGKGYGVRMIKQGIAYYNRLYGVIDLFAKIKKENILSIHAFNKAGFEPVDKNKKYVTMRFRCDV